MLLLRNINLTAKPAAVIARSLYQAPNLSHLDLSWNPLDEGVSDLTRHLSCAPHLKTLAFYGVKMTKKQVNDLSEAVRQTKVSELWSDYHVSFVIFVSLQTDAPYGLFTDLLLNSWIACMQAIFVTICLNCLLDWILLSF